MVASSPIRGIWLNDPISLDAVGFSRENRSSYFFIFKAIQENVASSSVFCCLI